MIREKETVLDAIKSWIHAYETRDVEKFKNILSPSETHISWGTGRDERYVGLSNFLHQVQRDFTQSEGATLALLHSYVVVHDSVAWAAVEIEPTVVQNSIATKLEIMRGTLILSRYEDRWVIEHTHGSWPYALQKEGDSFPS